MCHHPSIRTELYHPGLKTLLLSSKLYSFGIVISGLSYKNRQERKIFGSYILGRVVMSDCTLSSPATQTVSLVEKEVSSSLRGSRAVVEEDGFRI